MENPFNSCIAAKLLKVLRSFTVSVAFYSKFATSSHFWKILDSFRNTHFFPNLLKSFELLRSLTNSIAFYSNFATFICFWWINFFWKTRLFPKPAQIFRTFWEVLLILSHSTANLLPLQFLKNHDFLSKSHFLFQKTRILFVSKIHIILVSFCTHLLTFSYFKYFQFFRWKLSSIFWKPPNFERFRHSYHLSRFYNKHASLSFFGNSKTLYRRTDVFFRKNPNP